MPTERLSIALLARVRRSAAALSLAISAAAFSASRLVFLSSKLSVECVTGGRGPTLPLSSLRESSPRPSPVFGRCGHWNVPSQSRAVCSS